jgi:uncharacterized protein
MSNDLSSAQQSIIERSSRFVRSELSNEPTGHDWWHAERVRNVATLIARNEGADLFVVSLASLLHDVGDFKFTKSDEEGPRRAGLFLTDLKVARQIVFAVQDIIRCLSFKGSGVQDSCLSLEGKCVQDADRLDAIGAVGVARTFAYGGFVHRPIHDPDLAPSEHRTAEEYRNSLGTTINHFYEKLLLVQQRLKTDTAQKMARRRQDYMKGFLAEFEDEWKGSDLIDALGERSQLVGAAVSFREY